MTDLLARLAALAAALDRGDDQAAAAAAAELAATDGPETLREALRQLHLFRGFPRALHALGLAADALAGPPPAADPTGADPERGEAVFRRLYGPDAEMVLDRIRALDPVLADWILDHAYGRVIAREVLPLTVRERLALLLLAADGCWNQWRSHARIALRLGIPPDRLAADLELAGWLDPATRGRAADLLRDLTGGPDG
ncbi:MAG: hypothetical protein D6702_06000 [Planctomycetota bacterium]|nr:MAG: hypothetical protein D6702_06000 [Planctomycetota bacterium]